MKESVKKYRATVEGRKAVRRANAKWDKKNASIIIDCPCGQKVKRNQYRQHKNGVRCQRKIQKLKEKA